MKIGILTFIHTSNYGAALQMYAMQALLRGINADSEFINYSCSMVLKNHNPKKLIYRSGIGNKLIFPFAYCVYKKRLDKFLEFEKQHMVFSDKEYTRETVCQSCDKYDRFLVGSDQVWNTTITDGDMTFFLDFLSDNSKKLSYAASVGAADFPEPYRQRCYDLIREFSVVNVREISTAKMLCNAGINAKPVLDPTLLLDRSHWMRFVGKRSYKKKYIFMYMPPRDESIYKVLDYAKQKGYEVFLVKKGVKPVAGVKILNTLSPSEFLNWLYHADMVLSGSFHGVCFSVLFEKSFWAFPAMQEERSSRTYDLLDELCLNSRKYVGDAVLSDEEIDFSESKTRLEHLRKQSKTVLKETLQIG